MIKPGLRIAFAGTPELAATILAAILEEDIHKLVAVYTQPDRGAGRGRKIIPSPVKLLAQEKRLDIEQPGRPADIDPDNKLAQCDALVVAAYGMILPEHILSRPRLGCINVHTSLLPKWRGAAPIQRAIQAGDRETGITIMQMDSGLDTGDILLQKTCSILDDDTSGTLHDRLAILGARALLETLNALMEGAINPIKQDDSLASYAQKINKEEGHIDWSQPAVEIERTIRAFNPAPISYSKLNNISIRIWEAIVLKNSNDGRAPGTIVGFSREGIDVTTADSPLRITKLQLPGKKPVTARDFYNGNPNFMSVG